MKHYKIELTDQAKKDLYEIASYYIENDLDYYAEKLLRRLYSRISDLATFPTSYKRYEPDPSARYITIKHYYIFYDVDKTTGIVSVLRIIHQKRNLEHINIH